MKITREQTLLNLHNERQWWITHISAVPVWRIDFTVDTSTMSLKDTIAHLMAWQQLSIARVEAAMCEREPVLPVWAEGPNPDPDSDEELYFVNARIAGLYKHKPWDEILMMWNDGFERLIALGEEISQDLYFDKNRYPWLFGYSLADVYEGSLDHHLEHRDILST